MPYVWGIGLMYFGLHDSVWWMVGWCIMFVLMAAVHQVWLKHRELIMIICDAFYDVFERYANPRKEIVSEDVLALDSVLTTYIELKSRHGV